MEVRSLTEVQLRHMLHEGRTFRRDVVEGRWVIEARYARTPWEVIVEPDVAGQRLVVVTAYPVGR